MVACQAPLSMEFSRQESWSGLPFPFSRASSWPRDRTCWQADSSPLSHWEALLGPGRGTNGRPWLVALVITTSQAQCKGLCTHAGQHIQALSTPPLRHLSLGRPRMCKPMSYSPSRGGIGTGPMLWNSRILSALSMALKLGRGHGLKVDMCPWPWGLMALLGEERRKTARARLSAGGSSFVPL